MGRAVLISIYALGVLLLTAGVGAIALFNTTQGRNMIIAQVEPILGDALDSDVEIGALSGDLPGRFVLEDVIFSDDQGAWLIIDQVRITWRPFLLLKSQVNIDSAVFQSARLLREPPDNNDEDENTRLLDLEWPEGLPEITAREISIDDFQSELGGEAARLDGSGALLLGDRRINAQLTLTSQNDKDAADITIEISPKAERLLIDATLTAEAGGVISAFAGLESSLFLNVSADSPTEAGVIEFSGVSSDYGLLEAQLSGDFSKLEVVQFNGRFIPGDAYSSAVELSAPIEWRSTLTAQKRGAVWTIASLSSAMGHISGNIDWRNGRRGVESVNTDLSINLDNAYRPELQRYIGASAHVITELQRESAAFSYEVRLTSKAINAVVSQGETNLRSLFTGDISASITANDLVALLPSPAKFDGNFQLDTTGAAQLNGISIEFEDGSNAGGDASYNFEDNSLTLQGDILAAPALVSSLAPLLNTTAPIAAVIEASGELDLFTVKATIDTPVIAIGDGAAPPLYIEAALAGLPHLPTGDIIGRPAEGEGNFNLSLRSSEDGTISVPVLAYAGNAFRLSGEGAFNPGSQALTINLSYQGDDNAEPWPGLPLVGEFMVNGNFARQDAATELLATAANLRSNDFAIAGLSINAAGDPAALRVDANASALGLSAFGVVENISTSVELDVRDKLHATFSTFSGVIGENTVTLAQPATIDIDAHTSIDNLRLNWGDHGVIALNGAFSNTLWRADLSIENVDIPGADGRIDLDLQLDTDAQMPAQGAFQLRSLLTQAPSAVINGAVHWNGETVLLESAKSVDALDMRLSLPAVLTTAPALKVDATGAISGYARYDGGVNVIAAYLPPILQSLEGALTADLSIGGTTEAPEISGRADLTQGAYTEPQTGLSLAGLHSKAEASYNANGSIIRFTGGARGADQDENDTLTLNGEMTLGATSALDLAILFSNAELSAHPVQTIRANGELKIAGPIDDITATGVLSIDELDAEIITPENTGLAPIDVIAYDQESGAETIVLQKQPLGINFDLNISADDRIFIRGRGLESEWSADVQVINAKELPLILGAMTLRKGALDFSGRRFDLSRGAIAFDRLSPNNPLLDIRSQHETSDGVTANISITGRADEPTITLTSNPSLPSEDIMALVLFGKPADELSALESLQTAQALASLSGIGPFGGGGVTGSIRQAVGLDLLNIDIDPENGGGSLTVGKYVADGVFVSATQDAQGENGSVRLEYEVTDNISLESEIKQDGDQTLSANWKRDF